MEKLNKGFIGNSLLVCGSTPKDKTHINILNKDFSKAGIELFFMSPIPQTDFGFKTYDSYADLPKVPDCAYILSDQDKTTEILKQVINLGIKKILFYGPVCYSEENERECKKNNIETRRGCPLLICDALPCRIHAFFVGVDKN